MIYTERINQALKLCYQAHAGQTDKAGIPYVFHPVHLAEQMTTEEATIAALLHDVVEDTPYTFSDLEAMGFPTPVIDALRLLTHEEETPYMDYVRRLSTNPIARQVKMADLRHNLDEIRMSGLPSSSSRTAKYRQALAFLLEQI